MTLGWQADAQPTEPHQPGLESFFAYIFHIKEYTLTFLILGCVFQLCLKNPEELPFNKSISYSRQDLEIKELLEISPTSLWMNEIK